jgi:hypothetical protein
MKIFFPENFSTHPREREREMEGGEKTEKVLRCFFRKLISYLIKKFEFNPSTHSECGMYFILHYNVHVMNILPQQQHHGNMKETFLFH